MSVHHGLATSTLITGTGGAAPATISTAPYGTALPGIGIQDSTQWGTAVGAANNVGSVIIKPTLTVDGDAYFAGEITVKGAKLSETLANIEKRLAILHPNPELEEKWDKLHELRMAYVELEREIIEKEKMWSKLKAKARPSIK